MSYSASDLMDAASSAFDEGKDLIIAMGAATIAVTHIEDPKGWYIYSDLALDSTAESAVGAVSVGEYDDFIVIRILRGEEVLASAEISVDDVTRVMVVEDHWGARI